MEDESASIPRHGFAEQEPKGSQPSLTGDIARARLVLESSTDLSETKVMLANLISRVDELVSHFRNQ